MKCWICVVSKEHALRGIAGGFIQACHGKKNSLKRMKVGDYITFYCPNITFLGNDKYQKFLGVGHVNDDKVYQFSMSDTFHPFRMNVKYLNDSAMLEAPIIPLINSLEFIKDKQHWGYMFRFGHFEISKTDFDKIMKSMGIVI